MSNATIRLAEGLGDRYRIVRELGAGGMATVYLALDLKHRRKVAMKVLRPELSAVLGSERFLKEIELTASLQHPNILPLFDSGSADGLLFYVMPFIDGESLRSRLDREHQLPIPDAVHIASAVGAALDYAHRHGSVHRDIKPENILLADGNALVADFGIALALRDAGGARLTETGLSLGTPRYMSPEQATAERRVDARSDIYSLGATLYEMLAGEPPFSAPTSQGIIAKLLTQSPVSLRVLRDTVPQSLDAAILRSLAKSPADRFTTCREFIEAVAAVPTIAAPSVPVVIAKARKRTLTNVGLVALAALLLLGFWVRARRPSPAGEVLGAGGASLQDHTQVTTTGQARLATISADGKQLAFVTTRCDDSGCADAIDVQDVGGSVTRRVLEGAAAIYALWWSPDRRHLIAQAGIGARGGHWLVSALGGPPTFLTDHGAFVAFFSGGDSLLTLAPATPDSTFWLRVSGLDGIPRDSIPVLDSVASVRSFYAVPGTPWIAISLSLRPSLRVVRLIDRQGAVRSQAELHDERFYTVSQNAIWLATGSKSKVVRRSFDPATARFALRQDTLYLGTPGGDARGAGTWDVTADGSALIFDDGTYTHDVWGVEWPELAKGRLPSKRRLLQTSSDVWSVLSPGGADLAFMQLETGASGKQRLTVRPFAGGEELPVLSGLTGAMVSGGVFAGAVWTDSVTVAFASRVAGQARFERVNVRTGARRDGFTLSDTLIDSFDWLPPAGWVWIPEDEHSIKWQRPGDREPTTIPLPDWYDHLHSVRASPDGRQLAFYGENHAIDSLRISTISLADGRATAWLTTTGQGAWAHWLSDNTLLLDLHEPHSLGLYHLAGPGQSRRIGEVPLPVISFSVSRDMKRAAVATREYRGDIWMSRVVRR